MKIPDHLHRIFIIGYSGSEKTNALLILMKKQDDDDDDSIIDKIYLYFNDPHEAKYVRLINKCRNNDFKNLKNSKQSIDSEYWKVQPKHRM